MRRPTSERLCDRGPDVVGDDHDGSQSEMVDQAGEVIRVNLGGVPGGRRQVGLVAVAEAAKVRRDHVGQSRKAGNDAAPVVPESGPAMEQQDRVAAALPHVMQLDSLAAGPYCVSPTAT